MLELVQHLWRLCPPLIDATATELAFFVAQKSKLIGFRHKFFPENVVQFETGSFHLVLNITPQNRFGSCPIVWEQTELKFIVEILCDDLRIIISLEHNSLPVANNRDAVITLARQFP